MKTSTNKKINVSFEEANQPSDDKDVVESPYILSPQPQDEIQNDTEVNQCEVVPAGKSIR